MMWNRTRSIAATLALSAAVLGASGTSVFADKGDKPEKPKKAAVERREAEAAVTKQLAKALNAIVNEDGPGGLLGVITASDRDRVEEGLKGADSKEYKNRVKDFLDTWKSKYGKKFAPDDHLEDLTGQDYEYFDWKDKNYVNATYEKTKYEPEAQVRFVEAGGNGNYRLMLSNDVTGEEMAKRLSGAINRELGVKSQWPKDEGEAYKSVTRNLLAALDYDQFHQRPKKD